MTDSPQEQPSNNSRPATQANSSFPKLAPIPAPILNQSSQPVASPSNPSLPTPVPSPVPLSPPTPLSTPPLPTTQPARSSPARLIILALILIGLISGFFILTDSSISITDQSAGEYIHVKKVTTRKEAVILIMQSDSYNRPTGQVVANTDATILPGTYTDFNIPLLPAEERNQVTPRSGDYFYALLVEPSQIGDGATTLPAPIVNFFRQPVQTKFRIN